MLPRVIFFVALASACVPTFLVCMAMFWRRRHIQPIKARFPLLSELIGVAICCHYPLLSAGMASAYDNALWPCWIMMFFGVAIFTGLACMYTLRCWLLHVSHYTTAYLVETRHTSAAVSSAKPLCVRYPILRNFRALSLFTFLVYAVLMAPIGFLTVTQLNEAILPCRATPSDIIFGVYCIAFISLFTYLAYDLRNVADSYGLKIEFKTIGICSVITMGLWFAFQMMPVLIDIDYNYFRVSTLAIYFGEFVCFVATILLPLYRSYEEFPVPPAAEQMNSLVTHLNNQVGHDAFSKFLQSEYATENLYFWKEIHKYHTLCAAELNKPVVDSSTVERIVATAAFIYHLYVHPGQATYEINIPASILKQIQASLTVFRVDLTTVPHDMIEDDVSSSVNHHRSSNDEGGIELQSLPPVNQSNIDSESLVVSFHRSQSALNAFTPVDDQAATTLVSKVSADTRLDSSLQQKLTALITLFDEAQASIMELMRRDSYPRFLKSPEHEDMLNALKRQAVLSGDVDVFRRQQSV